MYVPMSVTLGPWGLPSEVIHKGPTHVRWLHGLCPCVCHMVTWFASVSWGYMVCMSVTWLHGLRDGRRPPQGAGETLSAKTHVPHVGT